MWLNFWKKWELDSEIFIKIFCFKMFLQRITQVVQSQSFSALLSINNTN